MLGKECDTEISLQWCSFCPARDGHVRVGSEARIGGRVTAACHKSPHDVTASANGVYLGLLFFLSPFRDQER